MQVSEPDARRISEKGWVVIPRELRLKYGLEKGTPVRFVDYGGVLSIVPIPENPIRHGWGLFKGSKLVEGLLQEHQDEQDAEK